MSRRAYLGDQLGGPGRIPEPLLPYSFNTEVHAPGRLQAEQAKLLNAVCLKAWGKIGDSPTLTFSGAIYQDYPGTRRYPRCHRSLFEPMVNGFAMADQPGVVGRLELRRMLLLPGAITDPEPPPANYGDRLLEIVATRDLLELMRRTVAQQPVNRPIEFGMLQQVLMGEMPSRLHIGYENAGSKAEDIIRKRGWLNVPLNEVFQRPEAATFARGVHPLPNSGVAGNPEIDGLVQELTDAGPESEFVTDRMNQLKFSLYEDGPSRFADLVPIYLAGAQDVTKGLFNVTSIDNLKESCARLEEAARQSPIEQASARIAAAVKESPSK